MGVTTKKIGCEVHSLTEDREYSEQHIAEGEQAGDEHNVGEAAQDHPGKRLLPESEQCGDKYFDEDEDGAEPLPQAEGLLRGCSK